MTVPERLRKNDKAALLAPSGPCDTSRIEAAVNFMEKLGLIPRVMESCYAREGYLAGADSLRADDLMEAFADPEIKGIFAFRGGYGAQRILPLLDYEIIKKNPKIFAGYSDISALHVVFNQMCGLVTYHTPMAGTELYKEDIDALTAEAFRKCIFETPSFCKEITAVVPGTAEGILTGGNLTVITASVGTPYAIDTRDKILFLEEIDEAPYRVDRMLQQLKLAGKLDACRGIVLGDFSPETYETLSQGINDILVPLNKPLLTGLPCGHCLPAISLPMGGRAKINGNKFCI
jgi:muramoyltetrapeptide carboxypeptidase